MTQHRLVGGRYELGELIGYGGMAEVHRGRDTRLGRDVAIKVLRADLARDPSFLNRFRREAQAAAGLNHPSIVAVYDTGEDPGPDGTPQPYIVMEFVEGRTLRDILKAEGRLPARRAMEITADVCGALEFSHTHGLIHRDMKPANVMITRAGAVKVMDFGIARAVADNAATVTQTANVIGTAQYLSPEQARGESVDARSDVYSTGCLLYELVTGVPPFQGDSPVAVAYQHVRENATAPTTRVPELPRSLDSIVMKALAKNQLNRYQSAGDMRSDLQRALADQQVQAEAVMTDAERTQFIARTPPPVPPSAGRPPVPEDPEESHRNALVWAAIVVALLLVIGAAVFAVVKLGDNGKTTPQATVPDVIGESVDMARVQFGKAGLGFVHNPTGLSTNGPCDDGSTPTTENVVCKLTQRTATGKFMTVDTDSSVDENSTIYYQLYVQAQVQVPQLQGQTFTAAASALDAKGLQAKEKSVNSSTAAGQVIDSNPHAYASVAPGSTVVLSVSTGKVILPKVVGKALSVAKRTLNESFPYVNSSTRRVTHDRGLNGTVADESPTPGLAYDPSTRITLVVYRYVPLAPSCTTTTPSPSSPSTTPGVPPGQPSVSIAPISTPAPSVVCITPTG